MFWLQITISNIAVASLIACLAWAVGRSARRAQLAHALWVIFFVKLITPPLVEIPVAVPSQWLAPFSSPQQTPGVVANSIEPDTSIADSQTVATPDSHRVVVIVTRAVQWFTIEGVLLTIWISGTAWMLVSGLVRFFRFHRLLQREGCCDEQATAFVAELIHSVGRHQRVAPKVLRVPVSVSPMLFGFGRHAVIVCPDQLWNCLSQAERHAFLTHETAHFCRRDHWVRWLEWLVVAVFWWFSFVHVARRQLERSEELCCDAWAVTRLQGPPRQYAEALLKVVDFISVQRAGIPQLASGMLPTASLEERLRHVMSTSTIAVDSFKGQVFTSTACVIFLLVHPVIHAAVAPVVTSPITKDSASTDIGSTSPPQRQASVEPQTGEHEVDPLPPAPQGFWNTKPGHRWADFTLSFPGASVEASATSGVTIELPNSKSINFPPGSVQAIVDVPNSQRIVIGGSDGAVRVWDLQAGTPVSLLGRHTTDVVSLAYHEDGGLVSADSAGIVIRWDMQSGNALASTSVAALSVESVRFSNDGSSIAVLSGPWNASSQSQSVQILNSASLNLENAFAVANAAAVVVAGTDGDWLAIDWIGDIRSMHTNRIIGRMAKEQVSAMVIAQDAISLTQLSAAK